MVFLVNNNLQMFKLFDISLQINGYPLKAAKAELEKMLTVPEADYESFIETKKREIVEFHLSLDLRQCIAKDYYNVHFDFKYQRVIH